MAIETNLQPGDQLRELSTQARIVLTNYVHNVDSWRFRMAPGSMDGDLTSHHLLTTELLREHFERVID
jgi:hypothetical protein